MELTQLKFVVDTSDLKNASAAIKQLADDVNKLNKPMQEVTTASKKLNKEQEATVETSKKVESSTKKQVTVLERQQMILEFMTQGFSKGQSSQLAYAKAAGALTGEIEQLGKVLQTQRTLMGTDPFDKSLGAIQALRNEYTVIKEVQRLYNAELGLSKKQMEDLAREKLRLIEKFKLEGATLSQVKQGMKELESAYVKNASAENSITQSIRSRQKALEDTSKAQDYVAKEFDRVNRLTSDNGNITSATNNKLIAMENALRKTGMSAAEQKQKLDQYRKSLESIQKAAGNRQVDYLSRALGPQITDIFVGLATGQSPMMVLLQQGGQLRDQFALAGVAGSQMGEMLVKASKAMVTSVKDIAVAIGSLLLNAITSVGSSIATSLIAPFKHLTAGVYGVVTGTMTMTQAFEGLKVSLAGLAKSGVFLIVTALAALAIEYVKVTQANTELSQAIALTGASLGMSRDQAVAFAEDLNKKTGTSVLKYISALSSFAKAGSEVDEGIIKLSTDIEKYLGQSLDKTAQQYAEFGNEPTKALIKIAKEQGFVNEATLRQVYNLEQAGKKTEAARIATEAYKASQANAVAEAKKNLDPLQQLWIDIKSAVSNATSAVYDLLKSGPVVAVFRTVWETIAVIASEVWYVIKATGKEISGIGSQIAAVMRGDFAGAAKIGEQMKIDAQAAREEQDKLVASILNRNKAEEKGSQISAEQALANSRNAKSFEDRMKLQKEAADYATNMFKEIAQLTDKSTFAQYELNKAQEMMIKLINDPKFIALPETTKSRALATLAEASAKLELVKAEEELRKQNAKVTEEYIKNIKAQDDAWISAYDNNLALNNAVKQESEALMLQSSLIGATDEARKRALKTRQIEIELAKELRDIEAKKLTAEDQASFELAARQRAAEKMKNLNTEIAIDAATKLDNEIKNVQKGISDSIVTALFEGGEAGKKKLRDVIVAELKKPVTLVVNAVVNTLLGNVLGSIGTQQNGGGISNVLSSASKLKDVYNAFNSSIPASIESAWIRGGDWLSTSSNNTFAGMGEWMQANPQVAQYLGVAGNALAGISIGSMIAGDKKIGGMNGTSLSAAGAAIGSIIPGIGTLVGGIIGGTLGAAFGMGPKKITGQNIIGKYSTTGASVQNQTTWKQKGGWFRSDKSGQELSAISSDLQKFLDTSLVAISTQTGEYAKTLGLNADAIKSVDKEVSIGLQGLNEEQRSAKIQESLTGFGETLAQELLGTFETITTITGSFFRKTVTTTQKWIAGEYVREGETASAALQRLASSLSSVNAALKDMNFTLYDSSLKSADFASKLADAFGGLQNLMSSLDSFYKDFFTKEERQINLTRKLTEVFDSLGYALPSTRDEFKKLVQQALELKDLNLAKILLQLQPSILEYFEPIEEAQNQAAEAAKQYADSLNNATTSIVDEINRLRGVGTSESDLQSQFAILTEQARSGNLDALSKLPEITKSLEEVAGNSAVSASEFILTKARLAQSLQDTLGYLGMSGFSAEQQLTPSITTPVTTANSMVTTANTTGELLSALITEVQGLRIEVRADVSANTKTSRILERVNQDGESLTVNTLV